MENLIEEEPREGSSDSNQSLTYHTTHQFTYQNNNALMYAETFAIFKKLELSVVVQQSSERNALHTRW